jgi:hypothetical protein
MHLYLYFIIIERSHQASKQSNKIEKNVNAQQTHTHTDREIYTIHVTNSYNIL